MRTTTTHRIVIPKWRPTTTNELLNTHPKQRSRLKRADYEFIHLYGYKAGLMRLRTKVKRRVGIHVVFATIQEMVDVDALLKVTLDGLVAAGYLVDDKPRWCEVMPGTFDVGDGPRMEITLEDI